MTTCDRQAGFTLLEVVIVLAVLLTLLGTAMPLASAVIDADRRQEAQRELGEIVVALESFYYENGSFPASLVANGFLGEHLQGGVSGTATIDPFGGGQNYRYIVAAAPDTATVYSLGENGTDEGVASEEHVAVVFGAVPGTRKTYLRLRILVEVLANHIETGGSVAGSWPAVRAAIGLGSSYDTDGFGTTLQWDAATHTLTSAGPDKTLGNADDITI